MYIKESEFHRLGFDQMEELRPEVWSQLDNSRKVAVLQDCVNRICAFERRPRSQVAVRDFASFGPQYQGIDAGYDQRSDSIILDPQVLRDHSYYAFGTALAQSMSAYQTRALQQPGFHEDANEVALWRQGIESYNALDATPEAYTANPLKLHAHAAKESFAILLKLQHTLGPEEGPEKTRIAEPQSRTATYKFVIDEPGKGSRPYLLEVRDILPTPIARQYGVGFPRSLLKVPASPGLV